MKELNTFREFLNEGLKVGDTVTLKAGGDKMKITKERRMFGSKVKAYTVEKSDGKTAEYDESQIVKSTNDPKDMPGFEGTRDALGNLGIREEGIDEGVWNRPSFDEVVEFVAHVEEMKDKFYHIGSDEVFNGLDQAIMAARELVDPGNDDSYSSED